jgi:hypothetical protein
MAWLEIFQSATVEIFTDQSACICLHFLKTSAFFVKKSARTDVLLILY